MIDQKTSLLIKSQLPEFIRDNPNYSTFVTFVQAYYEWLESSNTANTLSTTANSYNQGVTYGSKNILTYSDIDTTLDDFVTYYTNEFLPYFPEDALISKQQAVKVARQLYQSKGTPASYNFLFRILYNSDAEIFNTRDAVFKPSDGIWYVPKSLNLATTDTNFLNTKNLIVFGETTKSFATIENALLSGNKIQLFISNIERQFQSGEYIRIKDANNQDVLFGGNVLSAKIVGQVSQVNIDPANKGLLYQPQDPVIIYGGLNSNISNPVGATAEVGTTTAGSIQAINVVTGGQGYRLNPNTLITITNGGTAAAYVASLDPSAVNVANVTMVPVNSISPSQNILIGNNRYSFFSANTSANANCSLANAFSYIAFNAFPISSVLLTNYGTNITQVPQVAASSLLTTDNANTAANTALLSSLGILAPIQIANTGVGYRANDRIIFSGGSGYGANAIVSNVSSTGAITNIAYVYTSSLATHSYPLGGMGYRSSALPNVTVSSANAQASGASLYVPSILGEGATFTLSVNQTGAIQTINLLTPGQDYVSVANVSLKVQDILVKNVSTTNLPQSGDLLYQGSSYATSTYNSYVYSISLLVPNNDSTQSVYLLRVYDYNSNPVPASSLLVNGKSITMTMANYAYDSNYNANGIRNYGDGSAKATATFLNGLTLGQGQYLNSQGQPSSFDVLQSDTYNNYTYQVTVEKEISKYRDILLNLLHPSGMKVLGRYALKANADFYYHSIDALFTGVPLTRSFPSTGAYVTINTDFTTKSNNILNFKSLGTGVNLANVIFSNSTIELTPTNGPNVRSEVVSVNSVSNTVIVSANTWLTYPNVAYANATSGSYVINILSLTGAYDIINNKNYSNTSYPLYDIVYPGDTVKLGSSTYTVASSGVNPVARTITLTTTIGSSTANSLLSVNRTFSTTSVKIYGPLGTIYIAELITEDGRTLTTEDGITLLLG